MRTTPPLRITRRGWGVLLGCAFLFGMLTANWTYYKYDPTPTQEGTQGTYQYFGDDIATLRTYWENDTQTDRP